MRDLESLREDLRSFQKLGKARVLQRFFKTGKGEYGEGDEFLGLMTDETRSVAKKYFNLSLTDVGKLPASKIHEERVVELMIMCRQFKEADLEGKKKNL